VEAPLLMAAASRVEESLVRLPAAGPRQARLETEERRVVERARRAVVVRGPPSAVESAAPPQREEVPNQDFLGAVQPV
jgi:hypothetical protein